MPRGKPPPQPRYEPVFTLKATDRFAPALVELWIGLARLKLGDAHPKIVQARLRLGQMQAWAAEHGAKHPG